MRKLTRPLIGSAIAALAVCAAIAGTATGAGTHRAHKATTGTCATLAINGRVAHYTKLHVDDLRALPVQTADVTFKSGAGTETHHFTGALLTDVIGLAGPTFDPAIKNDSLRFFVKGVGSDGYAAIVSWGEIDPGFGAKNVLVAYDQDGTDLCATGARLVVPGDIKGGRYVSNLVRLQVGRAGGDN
ncbi:MAG TPA: molybdopterin-dependent oxidoreductase [Gaiellales bacterium]